MSSIVYKVIYDLYTYTDLLRSPKAAQWKKVIQEEYDSLAENHT